MKTIDLSALDQFRAPMIQDYVAVIGKVTRTMNLRIVREGNSDKFPYATLFQCGVDILPLANGGHIIITTLGFYAFTFVKFVREFLAYENRKNARYSSYCSQLRNPFEGLGFIFTDDTQALSTWEEDEDGNVVYDDPEPEYVDDEKLLEGLKCYDSTELFVKSLTDR